MVHRLTPAALGVTLPGMDSHPVAIVTGAGSGIGRAICQRLAARGYRVALVGRTEEKLLATGSDLPAGSWAAVPADVADPAQARGLVGAVQQRLGRLDVLVNNAGWSPSKPIAEHTDEDIRAIFAVNTIGPIAAIAAALPVFTAQGSGCVVNVSSVASEDPFPGLSVYGGAKAAMNTITLGIANECGDAVRAYCVAPGAVETDLLRSIIDTDALPPEKTLDPSEVAAVIEQCVLGERPEPSGSTIFVRSPS